VEKYRYPLVTEDGYVYLMTKTSNIFFILLISVINHCRKSIGTNSHADLTTVAIQNIMKI